MSRLAAVAAGLLASFLALPALALEGTVVDGKGKPIAGGRVCYMTGNAESLCSQTDENGRFVLPDSQLDRIRVFARGYLPRFIPAVNPAAPIALEQSATLLVRILDAASDAGITKGLGEVVYPTGRQRRFFTNPNGAHVRTLAPGPARVSARADGYRSAAPQEVVLKAGETTEVVFRLVPAEDGTPAPKAKSPATDRKRP